ncbi:MAG TPA: putative lipid II flippase FtsW [Candidatus Paceibacterota bacterium]
MNFCAGKVDKSFLGITALLVVLGFFIFSSASLGVLASNQIKFSSVAFNQTFFGIFLGSIACLIFSKIDYKLYRKNAFILFALSIVLTLLVFVPSIGLSHGGATRWIDLGFISFQPSELLKIGFVIYLAAFISKAKDRIKTLNGGLLPFFAILAVAGAVLLAQPDTDTYAVMIFAGLAMFIVGGGKWSHIIAVGLIGVLGIATVAYMRPYVKERIMTFIDPGANSLTSGYQIQQSLIAVGSGGVVGKGFGKSIQKFSYLPEPIGDSIFAVAAEEFGFIGASIIIIMFVFFCFKGLKIAARAPDAFGGLLAVGIVILIMSQMFVNVGGMIGLLPLTGIPLPFISHGGTALFITLVEAGIIMNISRNSKRI